MLTNDFDTQDPKRACDGMFILLSQSLNAIIGADNFEIDFACHFAVFQELFQMIGKNNNQTFFKGWRKMEENIIHMKVP
jgi:hypothetical protein